MTLPALLAELELLPCPFCGTDRVEVMETALPMGLFSVACHGCGVEGPQADDGAGASYEWNTRSLARQQEWCVSVPVEPTEAMIEAGGYALGNHIKALIAIDPEQALNRRGKPRGLIIDWRTKMAIRYKAMLQAAPPSDRKD